MKIINVYQVQVNVRDGNTIIPRDKRKAVFKQIGKVVVSVWRKTLDKELVWHLTNWSCWGAKKESIKERGYHYKPNKNDRGYTNSDMCLEYAGVWYCAESFGWSVFLSKEEAKQHLMEDDFVQDKLRF